MAPPTGAEAVAIRFEIDQMLAKRSVAGVFAYMLLLTIFLATTSAVTAYPSAAAVAIAWAVIVSAARLAVARSFATAYVRHPVGWARQFRATTLLAGLSWGVGCAVWTRAVGFGAASMIMLISTAGAAAGAMSSLGPSVRLAQAYLTAILGPTVVYLAVGGDGSRTTLGFASVFVLYLGFLAVGSKQVHDNFVLGVRKTFLLEQRAEELAERTRRMKVVLDTVGQGFLSVTVDGRMANERSAILERWLGSCGAEELVWEYLGRTAPEAALWLELGLNSLAAGIMPSDLVVAQLPRRFRAADRHIEIEYRLTLVGDTVATILMVLSDVTNEVERLRSEQEQRELLSVFERIATDRTGVVEFVTETDRLAARLADGADAPAIDVRRWIHTLKGNAATFGLEGLSKTCHELESLAEESGEPITPAQRAALALVWDANAQRIKSLLGGDRAALQVTRVEYDSLLAAVDGEVPHAELGRVMRAWTLEPTEVRLLRIAQQARSLARRLDKGDIAVVVEANGVRLPIERFAGFWGAFVHVVRNAIDHGLETPDERTAAGKLAPGTLTVRTFADDSELVVSLEDDGRGIDWDRVATSARKHGLPHQTRADLEAVLFADGISTKEVTTELSGRGVGMGAVLAEVRDLGGQLSVSTTSGRGTRWTASFPRCVMELDRSARPPMAAVG